MAKPQFDAIPSRSFAYLVMRKCGCSSIKQAISELRDLEPATTPEEIHKSKPTTYLAADMDNGEDWFTFTIVRNPVMRFLSFYANKVLDQNLVGNDTLSKRRVYGYYPNMNIDDAIATLMNPAFKTEPHVLSQKALISTIGFELDYIGKLESLSESVKQIKRLSGVELPIRHLNQAVHRPLLIKENQYEKLADYFRNDLEAFDYPQSYADWYSTYVEHRPEKFQREGFIFDGQAKLFRYQVRQQPRRFIIDLFWKVEPTQTCKRVVRIVERSAGERNVIWHLPPEFGLKDNADADGLLHEKISIPHSRVPDTIDPDNLFFELYFAAEDTARPNLVNYQNHKNMLTFALRETILPGKTDIVAS